MEKKSRKEFLRQQMELLAEESKGSLPEELPKLTSAMCQIYRTLLYPPGGAVFHTCFFFVGAYFVISVLVHVKKLFRGKT